MKSTTICRNQMTIACWCALLAALPATAQEPVVPEALRESVLKDPAKAKPQGLANSLSVGSTGAFNHSNSVVGASDGGTVALGLVLEGASEWVSGGIESLNTLKIQHTQTRTPQIPAFFKSADFAELVSTTLYRLTAMPWLGPYARVRATTQLFANEVIKAAPYEVKSTRLDGSTSTLSLAAQTRHRLSGALNPLVLSETLGAFANPIERKTFTLKAKLGVGALQVLADEGFAVTADDPKASRLEVKQIQPATQIGAEAEVALAGDVTEGVAWKAKANVFLPAYSTQGQKTGVAAMNADLGFAVSAKLAKWLSLDYAVSARRVPLVLDAWQVMHGVMVTAGFKM